MNVAGAPPRPERPGQGSTDGAARATPAVELRGLVKEFPGPSGGEGVRALDGIDVDVSEGEFFALLGPSGCGKTTTLRIIAGFEAPTAGEILIRGRPVQGVPPFHRPVNTVFQDYALFPHMNVLQNVSFGLRMAHVPRAEAEARAAEALEMVRLPGAARRKPAQLSGGQRQRVALARALVNRPSVLLLDEPLGALDLKLRKAMQLELAQLQQQVGITFVYVTHDQEEALTMSDRVAVMSEGRIHQVGPPAEVYERPRDGFVADFIGETNFLDGTLDAREGGRGRVRLSSGRKLVGEVRSDGLETGAAVRLAIRPEKLALHPRDGHAGPGDGLARLDGAVERVHYLGTDTRYHVRTDDGVVIVRAQNRHEGFADAFRAGDPVRVHWDPRHASVLR
ncbi:MAG: ABC transporter ATP-binding protein [Trueperaceae bacterium]|nr:ABC transporter ATP-binding protein [Trueperaceae bacterium]